MTDELFISIIILHMISGWRIYQGGGSHNNIIYIFHECNWVIDDNNIIYIVIAYKKKQK